MAVPAGFLLGTVEWKTRKNGAVWWVAALTSAAMMTAASVLGVFGPELSQRLQVPFFTVAKEVSVTGARERLESIISATVSYTHRDVYKRQGLQRGTVQHR